MFLHVNYNDFTRKLQLFKNIYFKVWASSYLIAMLVWNNKIRKGEIHWQQFRRWKKKQLQLFSQMIFLSVNRPNLTPKNTHYGLY